MNEMNTLAHQLPAGTVLNDRYEIIRTLGEGGFGITYMGRNMVLDIPVAIKEYYPHGYANRSASYSLTVTITDSTQNLYFAKWKEKFLNEARTLAKFTRIPNIVNVLDFFEQNGTAYIVMEYLNGITLSDYVAKNGAFDPESLCRIMIPMLKSLNKIHQEQLIHRDISPDNIMVMPDGTLKLYDFGAARDYSETTQKSLSVMLKPGFAPEEQYRSRGVQGPWTDVYAACATIYYCITGIKPDDSVQRAFSDELKRPSELGVNISPQVEEAICVGMSIKAEDRFKNAEALATALEKTLSISDQYARHLKTNTVESKPIIANQIDKTEIIHTEFEPAQQNPKRSKTKKKIVIGATTGVVTLGVILIIIISSLNQSGILSSNDLSNIDGDTAESTSIQPNYENTPSVTNISSVSSSKAVASPTTSSVDSSTSTVTNQDEEVINSLINGSALQNSLGKYTPLSFEETSDYISFKDETINKGSVPNDVYDAIRYTYQTKSAFSIFYYNYEQLIGLVEPDVGKRFNVAEYKSIYNGYVPTINKCLENLQIVKSFDCPNSLCSSYYEAVTSLVDAWEEYLQTSKQYSKVDTIFTIKTISNKCKTLGTSVTIAEKKMDTENDTLMNSLVQYTMDYARKYGEIWGEYVVVFLEFIEYFDSITEITWESMSNDLDVIKSYKSRLSAIEDRMSAYTLNYEGDDTGVFKVYSDFVVKAKKYIEVCESLFSSSSENEFTRLAIEADLCRNDVSYAYDKAVNLLTEYMSSTGVTTN